VSKFLQLKREKSGSIAVLQYETLSKVLSFNPDDERFYISESSSNKTLGAFKDFRNACYYFKQKIKEELKNAN
jgi:hypothetical protein